MKKRCPYCGIELLETYDGEFYCPNCGFVPKDRLSEGIGGIHHIDKYNPNPWD